MSPVSLTVKTACKKLTPVQRNVFLQLLAAADLWRVRARCRSNAAMNHKHIPRGSTLAAMLRAFTICTRKVR